MSQRLIGRSSDLQRLREEGYHVEAIGSVLLVKDVPYVNPSREILRGTLVTELELAGDVTVQPTNHVAYFIGQTPSDAEGRPLSKLINSSSASSVGSVQIDFTFSKKPMGGDQRYRDYHHKVTTYVALLSNPAQAIDPQVAATTFPVIMTDQGDDSPFEYLDTASVRAGISEVADKLRLGSVAIVGLGGTGAYVLDLVTKTPVHEIHLFDGDLFLQHNAFRSPGAPSIDELAQTPKKVDYFAGRYSLMRKRIVPHGDFVTEANVEELRGMTFVFLALDDGPARKMIVAKLEEFGVDFIDVGIGVELVDGSLTGLVRTTLSTAESRKHVDARHRLPLGTANEANEYNRNIQIADLNALNATLAVIKWKKLSGFYMDLDREHHSVYVVSGNAVINEDMSD